MWQISNAEVLFQWLARQTDSEKRLVMMEWMAKLADDPRGCGMRIPGVDAPVYLARTPVDNVILKYLVAQEYHAIRLIEFDRLP